MLKEYTQVRQIQGEDKRRWFADHYFDLIIWYDAKEQIAGFQLCYDITHYHRALTWHRERGYSHNQIDDGENRPGKMKASPILVPDGIFDYPIIAEQFQHASRNIDPEIAAFVYHKILQYGNSTEEI
ncbi:putative integron gene cassette protein [Candidatus Vecturithrix granuli]|uniref:Putative integron gene cassette protein n=1 Tax=Vecturithrix granuli TaxID=1499967 RepID=A0A081C3A8_VECG1|nr:putative integron gene cassette protein [Candidatus Vecturithrix granuli]